jgi:bifunctional UDP-N-acetylglucosamine pyrophosphorylase/glucosamine-1-phosphate N-acetyltransferase
MNPLVLLLCAGTSSRMRPIKNKMLISYLGKPILMHQFDNLVDIGLKDFVIVCNQENLSKIKALFKNRKENINFCIQKDLSEGIKGGVMSAENIILSQKKPLLIISSNDYVEKNIFKKLLNEAKKTQSETLIVGKNVENYFPGGYMKINSQNHIESIVEKPKKGTEPSDLVALVIQLFKNPKKLLSTYKQVENSQDDAHELVLDIIFKQEKNALCVEYQGFWQAIKYPFHTLALMKHFLDNLDKNVIHKSVKPPKNCIIENSYIEENVNIMDFSVIKNSYIGKNSIIGNHALIRNSHIGEKCVIGGQTEICRSYIGDFNWTHQNFIGDSFFCSNISLGAGCRTANLRLDEENISMQIKEQKINSCINKLGSFIGENVRIGINTSIMPGLTIGDDVFISSGIIVDKNIPKNTFIKTQNQLTQKENKNKSQKRDTYSQ